MRYSTDHKQATRQRILEAAGRRFKKQDGIDGAGVAAVMSDAGLTNGAFYAHFMSKEISSRTCSPTSCAPNVRPSTPTPRGAAVGAAPAGRTGEGASGAVQVLGSPLVESTIIILIFRKVLLLKPCQRIVVRT